jgi:hypothetical protein
MSDVEKIDTKPTTMGGQIGQTKRPAKLDVSPMTLKWKWAFELKGEGKISFPSLKQLVARILRALNQ